MTLSTDAFQRATLFVESRARPLDVARMRFHFDSAPANAVAEELERYQNGDGGFSSALALDITALESSALATSAACQYLREIGPAPIKAMASKAVRYLVDTFDQGNRVWRIIPDSAEDSPHAPWWNRSGLEQAFGSFKLNPTAELLGYLYDWRDSATEPLIGGLSREVLDRLGSLEEIEMHDFLCCKRLAGTKDLNPEFRATLLAHLQRLLPTTVSTDSSQWAAFGLRPLQVADSTDSHFYEHLSEAVEENLDFVVATQEDDGSWLPTWNWGGQFPDESEVAKVEGAGWLTVENLLVLREYGRIEGVA